ncbi:hypothetical protein BCR44DRAFT_1259962 [Catenaria anguillulae PL171]|uniref:Ras-GEF domain-containing protein n=1 Tax=Catenaria anguillulae PL171 TaxID=765915 RepID=A0A1Y2HBB9_9FUNG|nr:hypothetical protein BCR44DRAFT_1259962 [Catenaria anguillulae PL171]
MIVTFINAIAEDPIIRAHPRDYRLVKTLKRLLRSQDQEYKHLKQLHTQTVGNPLVSDLASWVHQLSVEKHFEAVYYPILMLVKEGNGGGNPSSVEDDGHSRDSGIVRSMSGSGPNAFTQQQQQQQHQLRGSNMSTGSTNSTIGGTGSIGSSSGSSVSGNSGTSDVTGMGVPAALAALVCSKRSFLLTFKIESIADQFMLIEEMMLLSIPWPSLIQHASQAGKAKPPPGSVQEDRGPVQSMIDRFNATCQWVATEVCSQRAMDDRVKVIEKLIRLAVSVCPMRMQIALATPRQLLNGQSDHAWLAKPVRRAAAQDMEQSRQCRKTPAP